MITKRSKEFFSNIKNKILIFFFVCLSFFISYDASYAADSYIITDTSTGTSFPVTSSGGASFQASLNSTSVDWEAVTGLNLRQYNLKFINTNVTGPVGWEIYYLDAFPCYGYAQYVRIWMKMGDVNGSIRLNCLRAPQEIMLAQREAKKNQYQGVTTNLLKCKVLKDLSVPLDKCEKKPWNEFLKDQ